MRATYLFLQKVTNDVYNRLRNLSPRQKYLSVVLRHGVANRTCANAEIVQLELLDDLVGDRLFILAEALHLNSLLELADKRKR